MTISCKLMGGLGNQLFQIFATIAYGLDTNHTVVFPYTDFVIYGRRTYWRNFLNHLAIMTTANPDHGLQICDLDAFYTLNEQETQFPTVSFCLIDDNYSFDIDLIRLWFNNVINNHQ